MPRKHFFLLRFGICAVVIVKPAFADGNDFRMFRRPHDFRHADTPQFIRCAVRMHARRRPHLRNNPLHCPAARLAAPAGRLFILAAAAVPVSSPGAFPTSCPGAVQFSRNAGRSAPVRRALRRPQTVHPLAHQKLRRRLVQILSRIQNHADAGFTCPKRGCVILNMAMAVCKHIRFILSQLLSIIFSERLKSLKKHRPKQKYLLFFSTMLP